MWAKLLYRDYWNQENKRSSTTWKTEWHYSKWVRWILGSTCSDGRQISRCHPIRILWVLGRSLRLMGKYEYDLPCVEPDSNWEKKITIGSSQCVTLRVQKLRIEYGKQVLNIDPENLLFLDEMGVLLGLTLSHARSFHGTRVYYLKPFYRGACAHGYRSN